MKLSIAAAALLLLVNSQSAKAWGTPASDVRDDCKAAERVAQKNMQDSEDATLALKCYLYLNGAEDMLQALYFKSETKKPFCVDGVILRQKAAVFVKYVDDDPALWRVPAAAVYIGALAKTFPCK